MQDLPIALIVICIGYALGATPTAYLVGRLNGINIFEVGSGNMGATNVARALGFRWALLVGITDLLKGALAVLVGRAVGSAIPDVAGVLAGIAVVVGHNWSLPVAFLTGRLRGGKGAATTGGSWLMLFGGWAYLVVLPIAAGIGVLLATRYVSLSVLVAGSVGGAAVLAAIALGTAGIPPVYAVYIVVIVALLFFQHRQNIQRLAQGQERRLGQRL
jgi:glycerol-3-phosphate acyltransferase PlsY